MVAHRRATGEEIMVGSGCGCRYRVGSRSTKERKRERRGANAWRNSWNSPSASYGCSLYNGAANTTAIPGGSEGELKKFDVDVEGRGKRSRLSRSFADRESTVGSGPPGAIRAHDAPTTKRAKTRLGKGLMLEVSNLSRRGGRGRGRGRAWAGFKVRAGVRTVKKWERQVRSRARAGWEKRRAGKTGQQASVGSGAVGAEKKHAACCTTLVAHHFHFHPTSQVPSPSLPAFQPAHLHSPNWLFGLGLRVPRGAGALAHLALSLEAAGKDTAKKTLRGTDGSVETGLAKLTPGRWNGAPSLQGMPGAMVVPRRTSETRRMSSLRGLGGFLKATNPVELDGHIHAAPPSVALISTDRNLDRAGTAG